MIRSDKLIKKFNLQLFAEGGEDDKKDGLKDEPEKIVLTKEELDKLKQSEGDKRVTEALKTYDAKVRGEFQKTLEETLKEHDRLAKLSEDEKEKELMEKAKKDLSDREKALETRERLSDLNSILIERKLPVMFAKSLLRETSELTLQAVNEFEKAYHEGIETGVNERLKGKPPGSGGHVDLNKKFGELNSTERMKLKEEDPKKYKALRDAYLGK